jgi:hypothetical protein
VFKTAPAAPAENQATYRQPALPLADGLVTGLVTFIEAVK